MSQMNPKEVFHNTAYSVQLPDIAGHSLILTLFTGTGVLGMSCLIHEIMPQKNILKDVPRQK